MRFLVAVLCSLLLGCNALGGLPLSAPRRVIDCDDPEVEAAATAAVDYINKHHSHGYKFRLNRIEEVKVIPKTPSGEIFKIELDLLETKCPVLSPTPLENCEVRSLAEHAVEGDCDVKLAKNDGIFSVISTRCTSKPDSAEDVADVCPTCPVLAPLNDTQVVQGVETLVLQMNSQDNAPFQQLHEIGRARIWTVPENSVEVEFVIAATNCTTQEAKDAAANCALLSGADAQYSFCVGRVKSNAVPEDNVVNCAIPQPKIAASGPSTADQQPAVIPAVDAPAVDAPAVVDQAVVAPAVVDQAVVAPAVDAPAVVDTAVDAPAVVDTAVVAPAVVDTAVAAPAAVDPAVVAPAVVAPAVVAPAVVIPAVFVPSHSHHHLPHVNQDSSSAESSSSELVGPSVAAPPAAPTDSPAAAPTAANVIVKRSLAAAAAPVLPACPGRRRFFNV